MAKDSLELSLEALDNLSGGEAFNFTDYKLRTAYETLCDLFDVDDNLSQAVDYAEEKQHLKLLAMYCRRFLNVLETLDLQYNLRKQLASELKKILFERWKQFGALVQKEFDIYNSNPSLS